MIPLFGGGEVRLDDLGTVTDTIADRRTFARFNGEPVVALGIKRSKGASDVVVAAAVQKRIDALKVPIRRRSEADRHLGGIHQGQLRGRDLDLFEGAILAVIVVLLFLRDIRATIIAAISLPLSIFPAFWAMDLLGILAEPGLFPRHHAVDRHSGRRRHRRDREHRAPHADGQIAVSRRAGGRRRNRPRRDRDLAHHHRDLRAGKLHVGIAGQFFKQFGITVSVQVFFSLLAARFVTPVLAAYFMKDTQHEDPPPGRVLKSYTRLVTWSVKHYFITVLIGFGIFAASIWSITLLPQGFLPAQDTARSLLAMELPPGSQLAYTEKVTEEIVTRLRKRPEIRACSSTAAAYRRAPSRCAAPR
jgi:multidrug efflux pump subunit AcrB